jgi:antitoxin component YwqK of YwqJK toxin-antitoxin module
LSFIYKNLPMKILKFVSVLVLTSVSAFSQVNKSSENQLNAKGEKNGLWKGYYEDSKVLRYEGVFTNGKETGQFKYYANSDKKIVKATRDFDGKGGAYTIFYDEIGLKVSEGKVINKLRQGVWTYYHKGLKSVMCTENYIDDKIEGVRKVFFTDGTVAEEVSYKNGLKEGVSKVYSKAGTLKEEAIYVKGEMQGPYKVYDDNGVILIEGKYKEGKKKGLWNYYDSNKNLVKQINADTINGYKKPSLVKKK